MHNYRPSEKFTFEVPDVGLLLLTAADGHRKTKSNERNQAILCTSDGRFPLFMVSDFAAEIEEVRSDNPLGESRPLALTFFSSRELFLRSLTTGQF